MLSAVMALADRFLGSYEPLELSKALTAVVKGVTFAVLFADVATECNSICLSPSNFVTVMTKGACKAVVLRL